MQHQHQIPVQVQQHHLQQHQQHLLQQQGFPQHPSMYHAQAPAPYPCKYITVLQLFEMRCSAGYAAAILKDMSSLGF